MAASPWPMPEVSTSTRSKPATLQAAITSGRLFEISASAPRVASERMNTRPPAIAFMRMRSPSSAPPVFLVEPEAAHQLIGERGFTRASGARHPEHRGGERVGFLQHLLAELGMR